MPIPSSKLLSLADSYGTPLYVYDGDLIEQRYNEILKHFSHPRTKIFYAMKANYNPAILKLLCELGSSIDAVSLGDVLMALRCGFPPERIMFTANHICDQEMYKVKELGVLFNIGSLSRLEKFGRAFPGSNVCIRINANVVAGGHENIRTGGNLTKFGILMDDLEKIQEISSACELKITGIHKHTGSGLKFEEQEKFREAMQNLCSIATKENFPDLEFIDFGGGFNVPYKEDDPEVDYLDFGARVMEIINSYFEAYGSELDIYFEPGKFIVAESGTLLTEVNTLKDNAGRLIAGTNSGFSQLIRPVLYQAHHIINNLSNPNGQPANYDVSGNICETGDLFARQRPIPEIREGDVLAVRNAGAYCYSMGSVYNLRAMPAEILVYKGEERLVRKRLSDSELVEQVYQECESE